MDLDMWSRVSARGRIRVLSPEGDNEILWDTQDPESLIAADRIFRERLRSGHLAYRKTENAGGTVVEGEVIKELTPDATDVVIVRPLQGG